MKIKEQIKCELARREFWEYCKLTAKDFYKEDRPFLKTIANTMQEFYYNDDEILLINLPPRHGKSRTATKFIEWALGNNNKLKIMTGSYNETLSTVFSRQVRGTIQELKADESILVYKDIFPGTQIKYGSAAANLWALEGNNFNNYLATSPTGTATGFGADVLLIDDIIKNAEEANNSAVLEKHWEWFTNTMLSRREGKRKVIIIMTRWGNKDLAGLAINHFNNIGVKTKVLEMKAEQSDGGMLCEDILGRKDCDTLKATLGEDIFSANYNQEPIDLKGVLYTELKTYQNRPEFRSIENYTDTADTGKDYLCSICYGIFEKQAYVIDVLYTQKGMEVTEEETAVMLLENRVNYCRVESNNGGRGFSRNVERITKEKGNRHTRFEPFTQSKNKEARILTQSTSVMNNVLFPVNWRELWPEFYKAVTTYQRVGKNKNDDSVDTLTGITEFLEKNNKAKVLNRNLLY